MSQRFNIVKVLEQYAPLLGRIAAIHENNEQLREDLIQDISVSIWRALESFRGDASMKTFIARIAHNRSVDHVLKETRRNERFQDSHDIDLAQSHANTKAQDQQIDFMAALHQLPLGYRQVITMQLEGFTQAEIGQILGLTEAAVAKRVSRARKQLEQLL